MVEETMDEEICRAVLAAQDARAQEEEPINGGGGDNVEDDGPFEPCPMYREVFQAVSIINRYVEHVDNPVARKLEAILASFERQIQLEQSQILATTHITDYFNHV
jgi:hypothetical protein